MHAPLTIADLIEGGCGRLATRSDSARLDTEVLLCMALGTTRAFLYAWPQSEVSLPRQAAFDALLTRRLQGEPVAYITGWREFWSLELAITPAVLVPRPETERLVELALARLPQHTEALVADIGTGSGAVALAIAVERPRCRVIATELSAASAEVARGNVARLDLDNVEVREGHLLDPLRSERLDVIVSNPPYVASGDPHLGQGDLAHEPQLALDGGVDGLVLLRALIAAAPVMLRPGAHLLLEHGAGQGAAVRELLRRAGLQRVETFRDYGGHERVSCATRAAEQA